MKILVVMTLLLSLAAPASANLDFYINDLGGQDPATRYEVGDVVDITESAGVQPLPNTGPYRVARVWTIKTKAEVEEYMSKNATRRRQWYLDTTKMSAGDLLYWNTNRYIEATEAVALGWLSRK